MILKEWYNTCQNGKARDIVYFLAEQKNEIWELFFLTRNRKEKVKYIFWIVLKVSLKTAKLSLGQAGQMGSVATQVWMWTSSGGFRILRVDWVTCMTWRVCHMTETATHSRGRIEWPRRGSGRKLLPLWVMVTESHRLKWEIGKYGWN